jgi:hypothetical protein
MSIPVGHILSRLTAIALAAGSAPAAAAPGTARDVDDPDLEADRPIDREQLAVPVAAAELGRGLGLALERVRPLAATRLATSWALSLDPVRRLAIAHALEGMFPLVGDSIVIDHLARDPDPGIRAAAARAARARQLRGGDPGVLARLADDPDPRVRAAAGH